MKEETKQGTKRVGRYSGYLSNPEVYDTLEGRMVPYDRELFQCEFCGRWLCSKMTVAEELEHDRLCTAPFVS